MSLDNQATRQAQFDLGDKPLSDTNFDRTYQTELVSMSEGSVDLVPWFIPDRNKLIFSGAVTADETTVVRMIEIGGQTARLDQSAANIKARTGKHKGERIYRNLGEREEHVLDALKYICSTSRGSFGVHGGEAALKFTRSQVREVLGHSFNNSELNEALDVLSGSITELRVRSGVDNKVRPIRSPLLPLLVSYEDERYKDAFEGDDQHTLMCKFHPLIAEDIKNLNVRHYNNARIRSRRTTLARYLERRLSHVYVQASKNDPYGPIKGSSILIGAGMEHDRTRPQSQLFRPLERALKELVLPKGIKEDSLEGKDFILSRVEKRAIYGSSSTRSKKVEDFYYEFYPTEHFVTQQKISNDTLNRDKEKLEILRDLKLPPHNAAVVKVQ
ncbi:hypothetical protein [Dasania marina]|mgnify:CR=1 FL=1|uniref:hypothetical protein n=1 Tax=Dasania marina TaxID=471499 RepID=UPI0030DBC398|tara:strand:+ start:17528 stop:18685 length:1158 start_codon:yes stop_codon:yes gene_type:complete